MNSVTWRLGALAAATAAVTLAPPSVIRTRAQATTLLVASGLNNPRGLTFGPDGALYVAEAGTGGLSPCIVNTQGATVCYGDSGSVTRIVVGDTSSQSRLLTGLPSLAPASGATAGTGAIGPHDVAFHGRGNGFVTIGFANEPNLRFTEDPAHPGFPEFGPRFGRLVRFQPNGKWSFDDDLAAFEQLNNPDKVLPPDSNPFSLLAFPGRQVFTDAGGNALNELAASGKISNLAVFPTVGGTAQAVPTGLAQGPDGAFYVGQLTGFPFPANQANVYRVPADGGTPTVFRDQFTKIIDLAFGPDGSLYVLQIGTAGGPPPPGPGVLIKVAPNGTRTPIVPSIALVAPGGIAIGDDGSIYVSNRSTSPAVGQVLKITP
jgi:sugar lactone lactonase YvrE